MIRIERERLMNYADKLINLFSSNTVSEIESGGSGSLTKLFDVRHREELLTDPDYRDAYSIIRDLKRKIEEIEEDSENSREQLYHCLSLVKSTGDYGDDDRLDVLIRMINGTFHQNDWNENEKEKYDETIEVLTQWKDFFLSYTNRNAYETNTDFKDLMISVFPPEKFDEHVASSNLLARSIAKYMKMNGLTSFFDVNDLKCGDDIEDKIFKYCGMSFTFVQLVENVTFSNPDGKKKNWCHGEFNTFNDFHLNSRLFGNIDSNRFFFILTDADVKHLKPAKMAGKYSEWFQKMSRVKYCCIQDSDNKGLRSTIRELSNEIVKTSEKMKNDLIDGVLDEQPC